MRKNIFAAAVIMLLIGGCAAPANGGVSEDPNNTHVTNNGYDAEIHFKETADGTLIFRQVQNTEPTDIYLEPTELNVRDEVGNIICNMQVGAYPSVLAPNEIGTYMTELPVKYDPETMEIEFTPVAEVYSGDRYEAELTVKEGEKEGGRIFTVTAKNNMVTHLSPALFVARCSDFDGKFAGLIIKEINYIDAGEEIQFEVPFSEEYLLTDSANVAGGYDVKLYQGFLNVFK